MDSDCLTPTNVTCENTPACESLRSKLANFTEQFFGVVTKTDLLPSGVDWTLGCGLDTGLADNPRGYNEGISCYFLRLLYDNILLLRGAKGDTGNPGVNGENAVSAVTADFLQPDLVDSDRVVSVLATLALVPGLYVFIQTSGWYEILSNDGLTAIFRLLAAVDAPPVTVLAGNVIVPVSPAGIPMKGPVGDAGVRGEQGLIGDTGDQGTPSNPEVYGSYLGVGKTDFLTTIIMNKPVPVLFDGAKVDIALPSSGTFYIVGTTQTLPSFSAVLFLALVGYVVLSATNVVVATYNTLAEATAALLPGQTIDERPIEVLDTTWQATPYEPRLLQTFFATVGPRTIRLFVNQDSAPQVAVRADSTSFNWFQVV